MLLQNCGGIDILAVFNPNQFVFPDIPVNFLYFNMESSDRSVRFLQMILSDVLYAVYFAISVKKSTLPICLHNSKLHNNCQNWRVIK